MRSKKIGEVFPSPIFCVVFGLHGQIGIALLICLKGDLFLVDGHQLAVFHSDLSIDHGVVHGTPDAHGARTDLGS